MNTTQHARATTSRGFTLFELLIAMVIFMSLLAVLLVVGTKVLSANKERSTAGVIRAIENIFEDYQVQTQARFPQAVAFVARAPATPVGAPQQQISIYGQSITDNEAFIAPIVDARLDGRAMNGSGNLAWPRATPLVPTIAQVDTANQFQIASKDPGRVGDASQPSLTLLLLAMSEVVPLEQKLSGIDPKLLRRERVPAFGWNAVRSNSGGNVSVTLTPSTRLIEGPVLRDAFGFPMRFVSPMAHGGYGPFDYPRADREGAWQPAGSSPDVTPILDLAFNPSWYDPFGTVTINSNSQLRLTRRGRPTGMPLDATPKDLVGDADEGLCRNGRPYFYSVGPDGDPRTEADNVYSEIPDFSADRGTPRNPN